MGEMEVEDDGPLEDWTVKEVKEECKKLGLSDKGKKAELIARIKDFRATTVEAPAETVEEAQPEDEPMEEAPVEESPVEEAVAEEATVEEAVAEEAPIEKAANEEPMEEEPAPTEAAAEETEKMDVEEDGPLEEWTVKELKDECKTLGLSEKGKKAELIERIREAQAKTAEPVEESAVEEEAVEETVEE